MSSEQRRHIRFSLDIPAMRFTKYNEAFETVLHQISIGGCLLEWDENVFVGDEFRLLVQLPNKNFLPLACKALYRFEDGGVGAAFLDITKFEQELLTKIIAHSLEKQGLPLQVDPFAQPRQPLFNQSPKTSDDNSAATRREEIIDEILSTNDTL